ncbi:type II secretion system protein GspJ [Salinicola halophilus]|uniref:type II secretion system protein GspJ n=1 Tax=Salinicola halophilus TaxID=184065 RepID=UPI000DA25D5A|nr:type II secretion system protein GspJ [Salinicola halophilus]
MNLQRGFTLLETLVVLMLMGLLLTLVSSAMVAGNRAVEGAQRHSESLDETRAAHRFLQQTLSRTLPLSAGNDEQTRMTSFEGEPTRVVFYAPLPSSVGGGLYRQQIERHDDRLQVSLSRLDGDRLEPWGQPQRLLGGVQSVAFRYRGRSPLGEPTEWLDHWPWPSRLPRAVRVTLTLDAGRVWVTQQVALRLDLSGGAGS